jgi:CPA2 family monovalent cation:H+ antiporter-2
MLNLARVTFIDLMEIIDPGILAKLGFIVMAATIFAYLGRAIRMPSIVVYILAGLCLGPFTGWIEVDDAIELISHIGIALLLFLVGLELSLEKNP